MKILLLVSSILMLAGCVSKQLILQTPVVSMTKNNAPSAKLAEGAEVKSRWCSGDKPVVENSDGTNEYGMIDQAVHKAHKEYKADFFINNRFYSESNGCVSMTANVGKPGAGGGASDDEADEEAPAEKPAKAKDGKPKAKKKKKS